VVASIIESDCKNCALGKVSLEEVRSTEVRKCDGAKDDETEIRVTDC
jgi:hypothetical protein